MAYRRLCIDEEGGVGVSMLWEYVGDAWDAVWIRRGAWECCVDTRECVGMLRNTREYVGIRGNIFLLLYMPCFSFVGFFTYIYKVYTYNNT
jgi:hypothetical protein